MRIAFISDIHGNLKSLEIVLADITREVVDQIICLGDVAALGPQPREVIEVLQELEIPCVRGNHEEYLIDGDWLMQQDEAAPEWLIEAADWSRGRLTEKDVEYLASFKRLIEVPLDDKGNHLLCFHGSPRANTDFLLAMTPMDELDQMLDGKKATAMIGGHTHIQMLRQHRGQLIVNTGSVGIPFEQYPCGATGICRYLPFAEYAIVNWIQGNLSIELKRIPVDVSEIKKVGAACDNPFMKIWLPSWPE